MGGGFFDWIAANALSLLLGLLGVVATWWYSKRSRLDSEISYSITRGEIFSIDQNYEALSILWAGKAISGLYVTKLYIWNSWQATIRKADLDTVDPLRVEYSSESEAAVVFPRIAKQARGALNFMISGHAPGRIDVVFDYFDIGDGVRLEIVHSTPVDFLVFGSIVGVKFPPVLRGGRLRSLVGGRATGRREPFSAGFIKSIILTIPEIINSDVRGRFYKGAFVAYAVLGFVLSISSATKYLILKSIIKLDAVNDVLVSLHLSPIDSGVIVSSRSGDYLGGIVVGILLGLAALGALMAGKKPWPASLDGD